MGRTDNVEEILTKQYNAATGAGKVVPVQYSFKNLTAAATTTVVRAGACILHSVSFNKNTTAGASAIVGIYNGATAGATTAPVALIGNADAIASTPLSVTLDAYCDAGLVVKSVSKTALDVTLTYIAQ